MHKSSQLLGPSFYGGGGAGLHHTHLTKILELINIDQLAIFFNWT